MKKELLEFNRIAKQDGKKYKKNVLFFLKYQILKVNIL
jgi:hypothetical protein